MDLFSYYVRSQRTGVHMVTNGYMVWTGLHTDPINSPFILSDIMLQVSLIIKKFNMKERQLAFPKNKTSKHSYTPY